jgi:hypothetical protein
MPDPLASLSAKGMRVKASDSTDPLLVAIGGGVILIFAGFRRTA